MMPLGLLSTGETGEVVQIRVPAPPAAQGAGAGGRSDTRIEELGIRVGRTVQMLNNAGNLVLLKVDEARVAIDRSLAMRVMIKESGR